MKRSAGFSLVEVLVASGVLVAVFLPIMFAFTQSVRQAEVSLDELEATLLADELADQLQLVPCVRQFQSLIAFPVPNPPPAYARWQTLTTTGAELPAAAPGFTASIDTGNGTLGEPFAGDDTPVSERPYTRLFVSPSGPRFRRLFKVHRTLDRAGSLEESEHLTEVEVKVEWDGLELSGPKKVREVVVRGIVSDPRMVGR